MLRMWTNGCYDILHVGHIRLFEYAKSLGDLTVGIDSDRRVKQLKGDSRPINSQDIRKEMLMSIKFINDVFIFDTEEELSSLIAKFADEIVVGSDYKNRRVVGSEYVKRIHFFERLPGLSTTAIIENQFYEYKRPDWPTFQRNNRR